MTFSEQLDRLLESVRNLGARRVLSALGVALAVVLALLAAGWYLTRPDFEVLYAGLDREDVARIGMALQESGVPFDVSSDGTTVYAARGQTASARMQLAEKGLPRGGSAGYELFDKVGALGLTSFMQNVTKVRALEGELARTIQTMRGVRGARVHIVLPEEGSFRRNPQPASASVVIRGELGDGEHSAAAVRHLVASAVGGLTIDQVTVLDTDGTLLASGEETSDAAPGKLLSLERSLASSLQDKIRKTLSPYLSSQNLQVSVVARLNTDQKQTKEVLFNPDARVERSVRVVRENQTAQNSTGQQASSVERNIPQDQAKGSDSKSSNEDNQRREETTNYEISSKTVTTTSGGYALENLSIAVLVNRAAFAGPGGEKPSQEEIDRRLADVEQLVASASGLRKDRGDSIKISAVDFSPPRDGEMESTPVWLDLLLRNTGALVKSITIIVVAFLLLSALRPLLARSGGSEQELDAMLATGPVGAPALAPPSLSPMALPASMSDADMAALLGGGEIDDDMPDFLDELTNKEKHSPQKRLQRMIEFNEERAATILKKWIHQGRSS